MNAKEHAAAARRLIQACETLEEAAQNCRVGKSNLSEYCCPHKTATMPADVIMDLEAYCGLPIYTSEMARRSHPIMPSSDVEGDSLSALEHLAHFAAEYRKAKADGVITPAEEDRIAPTIDMLRTLIDGIGAGVVAGPVKLRTVGGK